MSQTITYKLSGKKAGKLGYGRFYGSIGGLETIEKQARGTLCAEYYHDIDIVNCHPIILSQFAHQKYQRDLPELDYYINNRDRVLSAIDPCRDTAKAEVIRVLYGGTNKYEITAALSAEIRDFSKFLSRQPKYKDLWDAVQSEDNKYGTFLSFILQTEERFCMLAMKESLEATDWSVDVLCYDGVMIRKRDGADLSTSLRAAELAIKEHTGWEVSVVEKPMLSYDVPVANGEEVANGISRLQYDEMKRDFETTHFYHIPSNQIVELQRNGEMLYMQDYHADTYLSAKWNFKRSNKLGDCIPFFPIWKSDTTRRLIRTIDFRTSEDPEVFTMPLRFAYEEAPADGASEAVELFLDLIGLMATGEQSDYFLNWLTHLVKTPLENPKVAVVITGVKGCGKDTLFDFLMEFVVGRAYSMNYDDNNQFFAPHDQGRLNKFLVKVEEADVRACRKNASTLKSRITADYLTFNPKGVKEITAANFVRLVFTTNGGNPFEMDQGERRFLVLNAKPTRKSDHAYWAKIRKVLFTPAAGRAVAEYLLERDISTWVKQAIPISEYQQDVIDSETSSEQQFINEWNGYDPDGDEEPEDKNSAEWQLWEKTIKKEFLAKELYTIYTNFCQERHLPFAANVKAFGKRLLPLLRDGAILKRRTEDGILYRRG